MAHGTHKPTCLFDSSMGGENNASCVLAEKISYAREVARAIGDPQQTPTRIYSDNDAHVKVAMKKGSSARSKHLLRRYYVLMQRVKNEEVTIVHVPDAENPADFLTKFVPAKKFRASMRYVTQNPVQRAEGDPQAASVAEGVGTPHRLMGDHVRLSQHDRGGCSTGCSLYGRALGESRGR